MTKVNGITVGHGVKGNAVFMILLMTACLSCAGRASLQLGKSMSGRSEGDVGAARIRLLWRTETETDAYGFYVYRADAVDGEMICINGDRPLHAAGTTTTPQEYVFYDRNVVENSEHYYKLQQMDLNGSWKWIVGHPVPVRGTAKQLTEGEAAEIRTHGPMYRREAP